jgi:hypothetical protein
VTLTHALTRRSRRLLAGLRSLRVRATGRARDDAYNYARVRRTLALLAEARGRSKVALDCRNSRGQRRIVVEHRCLKA